MIKNNKYNPRNRKHSSLITATFVLLLLFAVLSVSSALAPLKALAATEDEKVYDYYGLFSEQETADLEDVCAKYGEEGKIDIVIITDDLNGESPKKYIEDFYDKYAFGYNQEFGDTAMILVNMYSDDRSVTIQGYGNALNYLNNDRTEHMLDNIQPMLSDGNYYDAMEEFAKESAYYMNEEKGVDASNPTSGDVNSGNYYGESSYDGPSDYYGEKDDNIFYNTFFQLAIAVIIGAVTVGVMAANSGGKVTVHNRTYLDEQHSGVVATRDDYIRTTTTRVKKPTNNDGGGRSSGGGGISSGGHSHSGGSRGF